MSCWHHSHPAGKGIEEKPSWSPPWLLAAFGTGPSGYRGQSVLAVAIKHKALSVKSYDVAFAIEDTGGWALRTELAGPPSL